MDDKSTNWEQPNYTNYPPPVYPKNVQPPQPPKRKIWPWLIVGIIVLLALCGGIGALSKNAPTTTDTNTTASASTQAPAPTTAPEKPTPTPKPLKWQNVTTFSGTGEKKTDVFHAPDTWKINYTCNGGDYGNALSVTVYTSSGGYQDLAVNVMCKAGAKTTDTTTLHQGGDVYLDISATDAWTITVQEQK